MREIKFRAKVLGKEHLDFFYGSYVKKFYYGKNVEHQIIYGINNNIAKINIDTLGQYTGLKDKNGKEIYEGDIVKIEGCKVEGYENFITEIKFDRGAFRYMYNDGSGSVLDGYRMNLKGEDYKLYGGLQIEIIGNIYENPELLKSN